MDYIERESAIKSLLNDCMGQVSYSREDAADCIRYMDAADVAQVRHGRWEDGRCSNCKEEAMSTSWDEPVYEYDWEENLRYSHTETHTEYHLTNYCPNCGANMDGGEQDA